MTSPTKHEDEPVAKTEPEPGNQPGNEHKRKNDIRREIRSAADRMARDLTKRVADEPAVRATLRRGVGRRVEDPAMLPLHAFVSPYLDDVPEQSPSGWTATPDEAVERAFYSVAALIAAQPRQVRDRDAEHGPGSEIPEADEAPEAAEVHATDEQASGPAEEAEAFEGSLPEDTSSPASDQTTGTAPKDRFGLGATLGTAVGRGLLNSDTTEQRLHLLCRQSLDGVHVQLPRLLSHARVQGARTDWGQLVLDLARWGGERDRVAKEWAQGFHRSVNAARRAPTEKAKAAEGS
jgi:CRISPR system Cascade subunit CasB